jgi:plastocyanin
MANTAITLTNEQGALVPSQPSVTVNSGDTVSFSTSDGSVAYLFFSPGATSALSPAPTSPVEVSSTAATFSFTSSNPGAYSVYFETAANAEVPPFPAASSNLLMLEVDLSGVNFGAINTNTRG